MYVYKQQMSSYKIQLMRIVSAERMRMFDSNSLCQAYKLEHKMYIDTIFYLKYNTLNINQCDEQRCSSK